MMSKYEKLFKDIDYEFKNIKLLEEAFTHNSMGRKHRTYQRLEFLGDRVLGLVVAEMIYNHFPNEQEGALAKRHASLVREESLADTAREIGIGSYLLISQSEKVNIDNPAMLSDSCEALIGAIYIEAGFLVAKAFVEKFWLGKMENQSVPPIDGKSALQEWSQAHEHNLPHYEVVDIKGAEHEPEFHVRVMVDGVDVVGLGKGRSKKIAEQTAATDLLGKIKKND